MNHQHHARLALALISTTSLVSCSQVADPPHPDTGPINLAQPVTAHPSCSNDVVTSPVPESFQGHGFDRYFELTVGCDKVMRFLAQPSYTQAQLEHVVRTARWCVTDSPYSECERSSVHRIHSQITVPSRRSTDWSGAIGSCRQPSALVGNHRLLSATIRSCRQPTRQHPARQRS